MNKQSQTYPVYPANSSGLKRLPIWPAVSITFLIVIAAIFPPGLLSGMNLYLLMLSLIVWISSGEPFDRNLLKVLTPFIAIIAIGLIIGFQAERWVYWKDAWYVSNPVIVISVGYVLFRCMPNLARGMSAFIIGGTLLALLHLTNLALHSELWDLSANEIRGVAGTGYYAPVLALTIIFAYRGNWTERLGFHRRLVFLFFLICLAAVIASFSRTTLIVAVIGALASLGVFARREWLRIGGVLAIALLVVVTLRVNIDVDSKEASMSFIGKLARSTDELTIQEYPDLKSINLNWRGYETARALKYYSSGNPLELLFGYGFGAQLDLGLVMPLGGLYGEHYRFIPIMHNGYSYLLVKGGATAIALFGYSLFVLYRLGRRGAAGTPSDFGHIPARLLQFVAVTLAFATWVIGGVFNKLDMFPFLLMAGFLLAALTLKAEAYK